MQSDSREPFLNKKLEKIIVLLTSIVIITLIIFRNHFFQSTHLLKTFGELSVDPAIAFKNDKPTFLEFYAEWCEVCKETAPEISDLKDRYERDINFVFLNVDNQKWNNYIRKYEVNGIPHINLFDEKGNLKSTFIGRQEETTIRNSIEKLDREEGSNEEIINNEFSAIKQNRNNEVNPRSHG